MLRLAPLSTRIRANYDKRFADAGPTLDEQQAGDAAAVEMQEIEREIDEPNPA